MDNTKDTRNMYETKVGHFAVPNLETFFPNTRKFSSLPNALNTEEAAKALAGKQVFMYCTGENVRYQHHYIITNKQESQLILTTLLHFTLSV